MNYKAQGPRGVWGKYLSTPNPKPARIPHILSGSWRAVPEDGKNKRVKQALALCSKGQVPFESCLPWFRAEGLGFRAELLTKSRV